jgi:hypothetical protein
MDKKWIRLGLLALILALAVTAAQATTTQRTPKQAGAPTVVSYQGQVKVGGSAYHGLGYFKFAIVDAAGATSHWSNDGTSVGGGEPTSAVPLEVAGGLFNVLLGDTSLDNMTQPLDAQVFEGTERYLRVWFSPDGSTYSQLSPDRRIAAVPYALQAERVQGYAGVVVVAKSGGDFTQIQPAVDSIVDASEENPYLVWVAPGLFEENVTLKPHVHLQGAGREATVISSAVSSDVDPPTQATVVLADGTSLRDLTVKNGGSGPQSVALLLAQTIAQAELVNVTAEALGGSTGNYYGIYVAGTFSHLTATSVYARAASSGNNYGLYCDAYATLLGGRFLGQFGDNAYGVYHEGSELAADGVEFEARNGNHNYALYSAGFRADVHGGHVNAKGGGDTWGIYNTGEGKLQAQDVTIYSEGSLLVAAPSNHVRGLENNGASIAVLRGGECKAFGGETSTRAIYNHGPETKLEAYGVTAEGGTVASYDSVYGLFNGNEASAVLRGGYYLARGGQHTCGIISKHSGTTLDAHGITAEGREGTTENVGLFANQGAVADVRSSALVANTALRANSSTVNVALSQLDGAINRTLGTLTCFGVYSSSYTGIGCP